MHSSIDDLAETLGSLAGARDVAAKLHTALTSLLDYDARTGSDLAQTLKVYVETGSLAAAAERLFLHRNSVLYRLQRIGELTELALPQRRPRLVLLVAFAVTDPTFLPAPTESPVERKA